MQDLWTLVVAHPILSGCAAFAALYLVAALVVSEAVRNPIGR
jgi:hypothetical protein